MNSILVWHLPLEGTGPRIKCKSLYWFPSCLDQDEITSYSFFFFFNKLPTSGSQIKFKPAQQIASFRGIGVSQVPYSVISFNSCFRLTIMERKQKLNST